MKRWLVGACLAALLSPAAADAQRWRGNPFAFEPYIGPFWDSFDLEADGSNLGYLIGFRGDYQPGERWHIRLNIGFAQSNDVATRAPVISPIYDNQWIFATLGGDFALVPGNTSIAFGTDVGVGWRHLTLDEPEGFQPSAEGWGTYEVVVPALTLRHRFTPRTAVWLSVQDYILDFLEDGPEHSPAVTVGLSFR